MRVIWKVGWRLGALVSVKQEDTIEDGENIGVPKYYLQK